MKAIAGLVIAGMLVAATASGARADTTASPSGAMSAAPHPMAAGAQPGHDVRHASLSRKKIEAIQTALNGSGEQVAVDGRWGPKTRTALADFQKKHGMKPTGRANAATLDELKVTKM
jgi:peptidoglycan hydrolase-like protein with peptidoglycan-binding domain